MSNETVLLLMGESSKRNLSERIEYLLDLMDKEHVHASTHSERNAYQAVIRIELQLIRNDLQRASTRVAEAAVAVDQIPF